MASKTTDKSAPKTETIHIKSDGKHRPKVTVLVDNSEDALGRQVHGFVGFLREKAIVGLAVGFVVATQVQSVVKQLIASFLDPLTTVLFGAKLSSQTFTWSWHDRHAQFAWGQFVYILINFFVIVIAIYAIIKLFKLDKLDAPKVDAKKK
jgi:large-conductance mechanosensitive channel